MCAPAMWHLEKKYLSLSSIINACHIGSSNVISTKMLACVNFLLWLGKNTFHWIKSQQHQIRCLVPMVLVSVKDIVSQSKMDSGSR